MAKITRSPAQDRARKHVAKAMSDGMSIRKFAKLAKVSQSVASKVLKQASAKSDAKLDSTLSNQNNELMRVAQELRQEQARRNKRISALSEQILADLEEKARLHREYKGPEKDRPPGLNGRELETLVKLSSQQWQHQKDLSGITVAEKVLVGRVKGDAQGAAIGSALIDATAIDIGNEVWLEEKPVEAEVVEKPAD